MYFTNEEIAEFRMLYKKNFNKEIDELEAIKKGLELVNFIKIIIGHKPADSFDKNDNKII